MHSHTLNRWRHDHSFGQERERVGERRTAVVLAISLATMALELTAGVAFGSMALLADGMHMASHAVALGLGVFTYRFARRHASDPRFAFGTGKVNALGAYTSAVALVGFSLLMAWESASRLVAPVPIDIDWALAVSTVGLVVNGASAWLLIRPEHGGDDGQHGTHGHDHAHSHGHGHADHNLRAAYLHVLADALTSILAIGALLVAKVAGAVWLDPLMGLVGAALVARWGWGLLRDTSGVLLDRQADAALLRNARSLIEAENDDLVADLHVWSIGPGIHAAAISVVTHSPRDPEHYRALLRRAPSIVHATIEVHRCPGDAPGDATRPC